jgi:hypothetical protein
MMILNMNEEDKAVILEMMECIENINNGIDVDKYKKRLDELLNNASDKVADYYAKHPEEISIYSTTRINE